MTEHDWSDWKRQLEPVLTSKAEEWQLLGYEKVTEEDVWACFMAKLSKLTVPETVTAHWIVGEVFRLKVTEYMNWLTMEAYKGPNWFTKDEGLEFSLKSMTEKVKPSS
ncbi:MAG: post-transcriptional regulator [Bacillus sp. (in: Bacteria)]|nr:post-transcriptional regulator [Bacillus sp. (in: firmicutes)]